MCDGLVARFDDEEFMAAIAAMQNKVGSCVQALCRSFPLAKRQRIRYKEFTVEDVQGGAVEDVEGGADEDVQGGANLQVRDVREHGVEDMQEVDVIGDTSVLRFANRSYLLPSGPKHGKYKKSF